MCVYVCVCVCVYVCVCVCVYVCRVLMKNKIVLLDMWLSVILA